jgi:TPR repeat protein
VGVIRLLIVVIAAILLFTGAVSAGDYEDGAAAYIRGDFVTAKRLWLPLAERGEANAQTGLARMYFLGQGVKVNLAAALDWCREAAAKGLPAAQYQLGQIYEHPWDPQIRDLTEAVKWYRKAADQGHTDAQDELGGMYEFGLGVRPDYAEAEKWFTKARDYLSIAKMYDDPAWNRPLAAKWYRKLAEQGDKYARYRLGQMYRDGDGVPRDYTSSHMWFNLAAEAGYPYASIARDELARKMTAGQIARTQQLARYWTPLR